MMRWFKYNEPTFDDLSNLIGNVQVIVSEEDIRRNYYPFWLSAMQERGVTGEALAFENALDEFLVANWAWEVPMVNDEVVDE